MGTVAPSKKQAVADGLVEASALVDQGNFADAIAVLEAVRKQAAAAGDVAALERVLDLANRVYEQAEGKAKRASGSLVLASAEALSAGSQSEAQAPPAPIRPEGSEPFLWLPSSGPRHVVQGGGTQAGTLSVVPPPARSWWSTGLAVLGWALISVGALMIYVYLVVLLFVASGWGSWGSGAFPLIAIQVGFLLVGALCLHLARRRARRRV